MRILHVHKYYHDHDGAGRYLFDIMKLQQAAGHAVAIFAMHDSRNLPSVWDKYFVSSLDTSRVGYGLQGLRQFMRALWSREAGRNMTALLKAFRPDIVHVHNVYTHLSPSVLAACRAYRVPVVMTVHDYALVSANYGLLKSRRYIKQSFLATLALATIHRLHRVLKLYDRAIDVYLASSEFVKQTLAAAGYSEHKLRVLPLFAGNLLSDAQLRTPKSRQGVLYAGRLEDYKGIDLFLQAAQAFPQFQFYVAGIGSLELEVREAERTGDNLRYLGFLSSYNLWAKMAEVELMIVPSRWAEPYGLVAIEAMACGTPVLVSDAGGLPEKIKDGVNGLVFKAGDIQDLTAKLKQAFKHKQDLERMGQGALRYAKAQADPKKHLSKLLEVYERLVIHR